MNFNCIIVDLLLEKILILKRPLTCETATLIYIWRLTRILERGSTSQHGSVAPFFESGPRTIRW